MQETVLALAATCHDPSGRFAGGVIDSADVLGAVFGSVAVNATTETSPDTVEALEASYGALTLTRHPAGSIGIGTARRDAVSSALTSPAGHIVYSDLDHVLRWATTDPDELVRTLGTPTAAGLVVVGRSESAWSREPERLHATEGVVNRVAAMALGLDQIWDLMIAVRVLDRVTATMIVEGCEESSIANDVVWPLWAAQHGRQLDYRAVDGLAFRARDDFGSALDTRDGDPVEWASRVATAHRHVQAMLPFVTAQTDNPARRSSAAL